MLGARLLGPAVRNDAFAGLDNDRRFTADKLADLLVAHPVNLGEGFEDPWS